MKTGLRLPAGASPLLVAGCDGWQSALIRLGSGDVIHSLRVPGLTGKADLIPGRETELRFRPETPGTFRGQCADFCGWQHAHMGLPVIVEPREKFDAWRDAQLRPAVPPEDEHRRQGLDAFLSSACVMCHAIRATPAGGRTGPELAHVGSRRTIAARSPRGSSIRTGSSRASTCRWCRSKRRRPTRSSKLRVRAPRAVRRPS